MSMSKDKIRQRVLGALCNLDILMEDDAPWDKILKELHSATQGASKISKKQLDELEEYRAAYGQLPQKEKG